MMQGSGERPSWRVHWLRRSHLLDVGQARYWVVSTRLVRKNRYRLIEEAFLCVCERRQRHVAPGCWSTSHTEGCCGSTHAVIGDRRDEGLIAQSRPIGGPSCDRSCAGLHDDPVASLTRDDGADGNSVAGSKVSVVCLSVREHASFDMDLLTGHLGHAVVELGTTHCCVRE